MLARGLIGWKRSTSEPLDLTRLVQSGYYPPFLLHNHPATSGVQAPENGRKNKQEKFFDQRNVFPLPSGVDLAVSCSIPGSLVSIIGCRPFNTDDVRQLAVIGMFQTAETRTNVDRKVRNTLRAEIIRRSEVFLSANYHSYVSTKEKENSAYIWKGTYLRLQEIAWQFGLILMSGYANNNQLFFSKNPDEIMRNYLPSLTLR